MLGVWGLFAVNNLWIILSLAVFLRYSRSGSVHICIIIGFTSSNMEALVHALVRTSDGAYNSLAE